MGCCEATNPNLQGVVSGPAAGSDQAGDERPDPGADWDRRTALKTLLGAGVVVAVSSGCGPRPRDGATPLSLAFCGQLLCVVPYEVTRARGHFADQGFDVELIYTRGGNAAVQALVGGAVDYAGSSFDVALQAAANGAQIRRVASTGRLPLFALAVAPRPQRRDRRRLRPRGPHRRRLRPRQRRSRAAPVPPRSGRGGRRERAVRNGRHQPLRRVAHRAGRRGHGARAGPVAGHRGGRPRARQLHGARRGPAGTSAAPTSSWGSRCARPSATTASTKYAASPWPSSAALADTRTLPPADIVAALPAALVAGGDIGQLEAIVERYRLSLYPERVTIDLDAAGRVARAQEIAGLLEPGQVDLETLVDADALAG